jgi:hypothetical protein
MKKRYRNDDVIADGERLSVPLYCMDSVQQFVSRDARIAARIDARHNNRGFVRVAAADGDPVGLHRSGWRIPVQDARPTAGYIVTDAGRQAVDDAREAYLRAVRRGGSGMC